MSDLVQFAKGGKPEKQNTPERIYNWLQTQLSVARFYGGIKYNGVQYFIAENEEGKPLVREDVIKREAKNGKMLKEAE